MTTANVTAKEDDSNNAPDARIDVDSARESIQRSICRLTFLLETCLKVKPDDSLSWWNEKNDDDRMVNILHGEKVKTTDALWFTLNKIKEDIELVYMLIYPKDAPDYLAKRVQLAQPTKWEGPDLSCALHGPSRCLDYTLDVLSYATFLDASVEAFKGFCASIEDTRNELREIVGEIEAA